MNILTPARQHPLKSLLSVVLSVHGLVNIGEGAYFVFTELPKYERLLATQKFTSTDLNHLVLVGVFLTLSTITSFYFAIKLTHRHSPLGGTIIMASGTALAIVNFAYYHFFVTFPIVEYLEQLLTYGHNLL